ncbi:MAG: DUF3365 domain-containing protein [Chitinophagaceae bacterium]|nr:MAG: DUF3365 domain-containing protein [Chitinophagaceae bacterium]
MKNIIILLGIPLILLSCNFENREEKRITQTSEEEISIEKDEESDDLGEFKITAEKIISKAQKNLMQAVTGAIEENGIAYAISYCNEQALELTSEVIEDERMTVSRVSHKYRNPANAANSEELKIIQSYIESLDQDIVPEPIVRTDDTFKIYYTPLLLASPLCLNCHGEVEKEIQVEDFIAIQMLYPNDKAVDFKMGELRGLWKVKVLKEPSI